MNTLSDKVPLRGLDEDPNMFTDISLVFWSSLHPTTNDKLARVLNTNFQSSVPTSQLLETRSAAPGGGVAESKEEDDGTNDDENPTVPPVFDIQRFPTTAGQNIGDPKYFVKDNRLTPIYDCIKASLLEHSTAYSDIKDEEAQAARVCSFSPYHFQNIK